MYSFKTTSQIFKFDGDIFDENWLDKPWIELPPNPKWDYSRELKIEDIDIWEVIYETGGAIGVYAAWCPYAEFYLIRKGWEAIERGGGYDIEIIQGPAAAEKIQIRMKELNIPFVKNDIWVEPEDLWLYKSIDVDNQKPTIIIP